MAAAGVFLSTRTRGVVALEDRLELVAMNSRSLVGHGQRRIEEAGAFFDAIRLEQEFDALARRREAREFGRMVWF